MESKNLKDVYNRLIDLYGFYEINKDSDEYKIALRFMSQEDLLKDDIDNIRLLVKDDGEDYMYFIINENTDYIGGGACGEEMITKYETINQDIILYYGFSEGPRLKLVQLPGALHNSPHAEIQALLRAVPFYV